MWILAQLLTEITGTPRQKVIAGVDFQWAKNFWVHNIFRFYEVIFWRRYGIRCEGASGMLEDGNEYQIAYTWEAMFVLIEVAIRKAFRFKRVKFWIPILWTPQGIPIFPSPYLFAIAFDTSNIGVNGSAANPFTWTHTTGAGSNILVTALAFIQAGGAPTCTINGVTSTQIGNPCDQTGANPGDGNLLYMFYVTGAAASTAMTVSITGNTSAAASGCSSSYSGVAGGLDNSKSDGTASLVTTFTSTLTTIADNCWLVLGARWHGNVISAGTNANKRQQTAQPLFLGDTNAAQTPAGNKSMQITQAGTADALGLKIASFSPTAAASTTTPHLLTMMGFGK